MERFIVGTGRCGSTLLSSMLAEHPDLVSIFEFFTGLDAAARFSPEPMTGPEFSALVTAEQPFVTAVMRRGYSVEEVVYPYADDFDTPATGRHARRDPVPWILVSMLPRLDADPDALFDELCAFTRQLPHALAANHYLALFSWLCDRVGASAWIERSGSSIDYLAGLAGLYPNARFLHLHRDGREVALSMRRHHAYRLPISLMYDVVLDSGLRVSESAPFDVHCEPSGDDTVSQILTSTPAAAQFGRYWADQIERGQAARELISDDHYMEISFEALVSRPAESLRAIAAFFELPVLGIKGGGSSSEGEAASNEGEGLDEGDWITRAAALVRGVPPTRFDELPLAEARGLEEECRRGFEALEHEH